MKTCTIDSCTRAHWAKGLCSSHYKSARREQYGREERPIETACSQCGAAIMKMPDPRWRRFCDYTCRDLYSLENGLGAWGREKKPKPQPKPRADLRSPLRRALETGDHAGVIEAIKSHSEVRPSGCWEWQRALKDCYPVVQIAGKSYQVHRLSLEAKVGKRLGKQAAHHICANSFCVNPEHLQPVTARENNAEMLARTYMASRIRDLEAALREHAPHHPLLHEIGLAAAS